MLTITMPKCRWSVDVMSPVFIILTQVTANADQNVNSNMLMLISISRYLHMTANTFLQRLIKAAESQQYPPSSIHHHTCMTPIFYPRQLSLPLSLLQEFSWFPHEPFTQLKPAHMRLVNTDYAQRTNRNQNAYNPRISSL